MFYAIRLLIFIILVFCIFVILVVDSTMPLAHPSLRINTQSAPVSASYHYDNDGQSKGPVSVSSRSTNRRSTSTTTPRSTTNASSHAKAAAAKKKDAEKELQEMKVNLSRFTRANNHKAALETLQGCNAVASIPLESVPASPTSQKQWQSLEKEVGNSSHRFVLNEVSFEGATLRSEFTPVLKALCSKLTESSKTTGGIDSNSVYKVLIIRLAPTTSSADSYFHLNALLGTGDLLLQPVSAPQHLKSILGHKPAADLTLYESVGHVHTVLHTNHAYGLFRKSDLSTAAAAGAGAVAKPWIGVSAVVHERMNMTTGASVRQIKVQFM
jgi:hypothetical protein